MVDQAVIAERMKNTSWEAIGAELGGVTKSAAQKRFGQAVTTWMQEFEREVLSSDPYAVGFPTAWEQLASCWEAADGIVHAQEDIAALTNATAAASGSVAGWEEAAARVAHTHSGPDALEALATGNLQPPRDLLRLTPESMAALQSYFSAQKERVDTQAVLKTLRTPRLPAENEPQPDPASDDEGLDALRRAARLRSLEERVSQLEQHMADTIRWSPEAQQAAEQQMAARSTAAETDADTERRRR
ncbi:hypothetical protein [Streptomyces sp. NPDC095817]|uniref:hypothetical protein n=1 Tax=Streptomyces sp. NPDC095817 TaxID=3155082 RepID=UPI00332A554D